jgi:hypothetical protein
MKKQFVLIAAFSTLVLLGCEKNDETTGLDVLTVEEKAVVENDAASDNLKETADYEVDFLTGSDAAIESIEDNSKNGPHHRPRYVNGVGPAVTVDPIGYSFPKTITIDYGDGLELVNGRVLSGIIVIEVSAPIFVNGSTREVTYQDFYIDSTHFAGGGIRTFIGTDSTERVFSSVSDITITFADETVLNRHGERTRRLVQGFETICDHSDDLILIDGFVNYETSDQTTFGKTIIESLTKIGGCKFIVEGVVEFNYNGEDFATLDYGDGSCDDVATITKDGETRQITLERRRKFPWLR